MHPAKDALPIFEEFTTSVRGLANDDGLAKRVSPLGFNQVVQCERLRSISNRFLALNLLSQLDVEIVYFVVSDVFK